MTTFGDQVYQFGGAPVDSSFAGMWGDVWFVNDATGSNGNVGTKPNAAFKTPTKAIQMASDNDTIYIAPGTYDEEIAITTITQNNLRLIGTGGHGGYGQASKGVFWRGDVGTFGGTQFHDILNIEGSNVEVAGISFYVARGSYPGSHDGAGVTNDYRGISIGYNDIGNPYGTYIHDCMFFCEGVTYGTGIAVGERTTSMMGDAADTTIERCIFHQLGAGVYSDASRCMVKDSYFIVNGCGGTAAAGILHRPIEAQRINSVYINNSFIRNEHGSNGSPYGIYFYGTPNDGTAFVDRNHFSGNFADKAHCMTYETTNIDGFNGLNYYEDSAIS